MNGRMVLGGLSAVLAALGLAALLISECVPALNTAMQRATGTPDWCFPVALVCWVLAAVCGVFGRRYVFGKITLIVLGVIVALVVFIVWGVAHYGYKE